VCSKDDLLQNNSHTTPAVRADVGLDGLDLQLLLSLCAPTTAELMTLAAVTVEFRAAGHRGRRRQVPTEVGVEKCGDRDEVRESTGRNAVVFPLYQLVLLFIFFVGFAAVLKVPGLKGTDSDLALLRLSREAFAPWFVGVIGVTGMLTALVPGSMLLTTSATMLAKNVYAELRPGTSPENVMRLAQLLVPVLAVVTLLITFGGGSTIVALLLLGYAFVTQLFPALIASLLPRNPVTTWGAATGMVVGVAVVSYVIIAKRSVGSLLPFLPGWAATLNVGIVALVANVLALAIVSTFTKGARQASAPGATSLEPARGGTR
jgi:SSS family solute:Na+ symporter